MPPIPDAVRKLANNATLPHEHLAAMAVQIPKWWELDWREFMELVVTAHWGNFCWDMHLRALRVRSFRI